MARLWIAALLCAATHAYIPDYSGGYGGYGAQQGFGAQQGYGAPQGYGAGAWGGYGGGYGAYGQAAASLPMCPAGTPAPPQMSSYSLPRQPAANNAAIAKAADSMRPPTAPKATRNAPRVTVTVTTTMHVRPSATPRPSRRIRRRQRRRNDDEDTDDE